MSDQRPSAPFTVPHDLEGTPYQLVELLGQGGMGAVYRAVNTLEPYTEPRAIKFCLDPDRVRLLHREKQLLERLQRDREQLASGVVRLIGYQLDGLNPFLVYEYMRGGDLANWLSAHGRQSPETALSMVQKIAMALAVVHRAGLVHRDLKPTNILMDRSGPEVQVKLSDFGIGAVVEGADLTRLDKGMARSTQAHTTTLLHGSGTPLYMCTEQARGDPPDPRHDIYALGVIWFQVLLGDASHPLVPGWEDLLAEAGKVPDRHIDLIRRCVGISKSRPASAEALLTLLETTRSPKVGQEPDPAPAPEAPRPPVPGPDRVPPKEPLGVRWRWLATGLGTCLAAIALVVWLCAPRPMIRLDLGRGVTMDLVLVPAGKFMMGSPASEENREGYEGPVHEVTIGQPFYMGRTEVTQEQWWVVMGANPSHFHGHGANSQRPVESVSWEHCQAFCRKLSQMTGRTVRLPTEAEWEYACRAGTTTRFSFGDDPDYSLLPQYAWFSDNSGPKTHPVGQKRSNAWGLYDMHGNVWEWCQDVWHANYTGAPADGSAWMAGGDQGRRVVRGGGWFYFGGRLCRSANRVGCEPGYRTNYYGFRVVVSGSGTP